jgi:hypothetical protein
MSALWFDATCRAEESGVKPPRSKKSLHLRIFAPLR